MADVKRPFTAMKKICGKGNHVMSGPQKEDNHISSKAMEDKMMLKPTGRGSYVMEVEFVRREKTTITVDSGVEENVCSWEG